MNQARHAVRRAGAFTLTELLVVISIIILILAMALPAFGSMLYSMSLSTAQNALHVAVTSARDAAVRSAYGQDAAAVFTYAPNGRLTVVPCVWAGRLTDKDAKGNVVEREVFVPATGVEPVQLPHSWAVSGYAPLYTIDDPNNPNGGQSGWYESGNYPPSQGNWVFPESEFFGRINGQDADDGGRGRNRQTFMIRFEGGTGAVAIATTDPVLVVLPSASLGFRSVPPWTIGGGKGNRVDQAPDLARVVERILSGDADGNGTLDAPGDPNNGDGTARRRLLGDESSDTVLARPVPQVALYNLRKLAGAAGATGLSRQTESLYTDINGKPEFDPQIFGGSPDPVVIAQRVNDWIQGGLKINGTPIASDAIVFSFQRYLGDPQELIQPEAP